MGAFFTYFSRMGVLTVAVCGLCTMVEVWGGRDVAYLATPVTGLKFTFSFWGLAALD